MLKKHWKLPKNVTECLYRLEQHGYTAYIVGGCVRDLLLGVVPHDWDICTSALPAQIKKIFSDCKTLDIGEKHGTITVIFEKKTYEITTYRIDGSYTDHRKPDTVMYTDNLEEDLRRRDFTINAMAFHPQKGILDYFRGQEDLQLRCIRCVGNPQTRFSEDALRIIRGLRFAAYYSFHLEQQTASAAIQLRKLLQKISTERIDAEFQKMLQTSTPSALVTVLREYFPIWTIIFPEWNSMKWCTQNHPRHLYSVWEHTLHALEQTPNDPIIRWVILFHDSGKPMTKSTDSNGIDHFIGHAAVSETIARQVLIRLHADKKRIHDVCTLIRLQEKPLPVTRKSMKRLMMQEDVTTILRLFDIHQADCAGQNPMTTVTYRKDIQLARECLQQLLQEKACLHLKDLQISGKDLLAIGIPEGPIIGKTLQYLLEIIVDETIPNTREALITAAQDYYQNEIRQHIIKK